MNPREWMKSDEHLPEFLRDFHDAKDFFKNMEQSIKPVKDLDGHTWVSNHIFAIDVFLWYCGIHGYTLQRSRKRGVEFEDIEEKIRQFKDLQTARFAKMLSAAPSSEESKGDTNG